MRNGIDEIGKADSGKVGGRLENLTDEELHQMAQELLEKIRIRREVEADWYDRHPSSR